MSSKKKTCKTGLFEEEEVVNIPKSSEVLCSYFRILGPLKPVKVEVKMDLPSNIKNFRDVQMLNEEFIALEVRKDGRIPELYLSKSCANNPTFFRFTQVLGGEYIGLKTLRIKDCVGLSGRVFLEKKNKMWCILGLNHSVPGEFELNQNTLTGFLFPYLMIKVLEDLISFKDLQLSERFQRVKKSVDEKNTECQQKIERLSSEMSKVFVTLQALEILESDFNHLMISLKQGKFEEFPQDVTELISEGKIHEVVVDYFDRIVLPFLQKKVLSEEVVTCTESFLKSEHLSEEEEEDEEEEKRVFKVEYYRGLILLENHFRKLYVTDGKKNAGVKVDGFRKLIFETYSNRDGEVTEILSSFQNGRIIKYWKSLERYSILSFSLRMRCVQRCFEKFLDNDFKNPKLPNDHLFGSSSIIQHKEEPGQPQQKEEDENENEGELEEGEDEMITENFKEILGVFKEDLELLFVQSSKDELYRREEGVEEISKDLLEFCCQKRDLGVQENTFFRTPWKMEEGFSEGIVQIMLRMMKKTIGGKKKLSKMTELERMLEGRKFSLFPTMMKGKILDNGSIFLSGSEECLVCFQASSSIKSVSEESVNIGRVRSENEVLEKFVQYNSQFGYDKITEVMKKGFEEQNQKIDEQNKKIDNLTTEIQSLKGKIISTSDGN